MFRESILNHLSNYIKLTPEEEKFFLSKIKERKYLKGQFVTQEGDVCRQMTFVVAGSLRFYFLDNKGNRHTIGFAVENWWTGDLKSFISQQPAEYNVQCCEDCHVVQISYDNMELLVNEIPKIERFHRILFQNAYVAIMSRLVDDMSLTIKEKYLKFKSKYPQFESRFPQYMLASYLGCTPEFLSKIKKEL